MDVEPRFDESGETADVAFRVREGPQVFVDHVLIVGNRQISASTIRRELALRTGEPLGRDEIDETRRRLAALGIFQRIELREFSHGAADRRDVVVVVEEAPPTSVGYGGGMEASQRLRAAASGVAAEQLKFAPRGFFEIGRRSLWDKNRSIDLYTRVSLWPRGARRRGLADRPRVQRVRVSPELPRARAFGQYGDLLVSGFAEQVIRPSFDLIEPAGLARTRMRVCRLVRKPASSTSPRRRAQGSQLCHRHASDEDETLAVHQAAARSAGPSNRQSAGCRRKHAADPSPVLGGRPRLDLAPRSAVAPAL